jgi:hypothetical protein
LPPSRRTPRPGAAAPRTSPSASRRAPRCSEDRCCNLPLRVVRLPIQYCAYGTTSLFKPRWDQRAQGLTQFPLVAVLVLRQTCPVLSLRRGRGRLDGDGRAAPRRRCDAGGGRRRAAGGVLANSDPGGRLEAVAAPGSAAAPLTPSTRSRPRCRSTALAARTGRAGHLLDRRAGATAERAGSTPARVPRGDAHAVTLPLRKCRRSLSEAQPAAGSRAGRPAERA